MELLAKGSPVALGDAGAIERLKFTAARLAEAATRKPDYAGTREYAAELAGALWPRLGYVCDPQQQTAIRSIFGDALASAVVGETAPQTLPAATPAEPDNPDQTAANGTSEPGAAPTSHAESPPERIPSEVAAADVSSGPDADASHQPQQSYPNEAEPYRFDNCTVTVTVTLLPATTDSGDRRAVVGVRTHESAPAISCRLVRGGDALAGDISAALGDALAKCRLEMPIRAAEALRKASKTQAAGKKSRKKTKAAAAAVQAPKPDLFETETE